jgi:hypothetical protein
MNDKMVAMWLSIALVFQVIAIFTAFIYVFAKADNGMHVMLKTGFALSVFGLVVQIVRSIHYLDAGYYPIDHYVPIWLSKDIGIMILIWYFSFVHPKVK